MPVLGAFAVTGLVLGFVVVVRGVVVLGATFGAGVDTLGVTRTLGVGLLVDIAAMVSIVSIIYHPLAVILLGTA